MWKHKEYVLYSRWVRKKIENRYDVEPQTKGQKIQDQIVAPVLFLYWLLCIYSV